MILGEGTDLHLTADAANEPPAINRDSSGFDKASGAVGIKPRRSKTKAIK